jgi:hypothetical protein
MTEKLRLSWMGWIAVAGVACGSMSCAGWFMTGARQHKGPPPLGAVAVFTAPNCVLANGNSIPGPATTYYLVRGRKGVELIEIERSGRSSAISNYWRDDTGHNFATYVRRQNAWQFVIPDNPEEPGERVVFSRYGVSNHAGGFRLVGQPVARCALVRQDVVPASVPPAVSMPPPEPGPPSPPSAPPVVEAPPADAEPPAGACVPGATQECVGAGACRGGQACLPDGSAFGPCDCGGQ